MANVYVYHSGQPNIPQLTAAGGAGQLETLLYAIGVTGFSGGVLDSLTQTGGEATATRSAGLGLADGLVGMPHVIVISGSSNGWDGEYSLNATPGSTTCTFAVPSNLPSPATGTVTLKRAPCGLSRLASADNKSVWRFSDTERWPGYLLLNDSYTDAAGVRLAETAADPVDYSTMAGLCPTAAQHANPGLWIRRTNTSTGGGNRNFIVVADAAGMYVGIAAYGGYNLTYEWHYFGACNSLLANDSYAGLIIASISSEIYTTAPGTMSVNNFQAKNTTTNSNQHVGHYLQRAFTGIGSAQPCMKIGLAGSGWIGECNYCADPNPVNNAVLVHGPLLIFEGNQYNLTVAGTKLRGILPGLYDPLNAVNKNNFDLLTGIANLPGRTLMLANHAVSIGANNLCKVAFDITGPWR